MSNVLLLTLPIIISILVNSSESAKILASVFTPSFSHNLAFKPLWIELAKRGHEITLLTTDPMKNPDLENIKEIDLSKSYDILSKNNVDDLMSKQNRSKNVIQLFDDYMKTLGEVADWQLSHKEVQSLIQNKSTHFDLLFIEVMFPTHLGFVERFKVPYIGITSLDAPPRVHAAVGNVVNFGLYPDYLFSFRAPLTFLQRVISTVVQTLLDGYIEYYVFPREDETIRKHFGKTRGLKELHKDMSMLFTNVNPLFHNYRPLGPNTIQFGGNNILKELKPLPKDLQTFLDGAKNGFIYFSLGTNVKSKSLDPELRDTFIQTFAELPYKVLWKYEDDQLPNKPDNVKIIKWAPQQDILRHPNVKLFISQLGLQSIEEAIFSNVPLVGIPFLTEQMNNAVVIKSKGLGIYLNKATMTKENFTNAINEVINNPVYKENMKKAMKLTLDLEMPGIEKAVWWTEYILRHKHQADIFRSPAVDMPFYQFYLLDVIGTVTVVVLLFIYLSIKVVKCGLHLVSKLLFKKIKKE